MLSEDDKFSPSLGCHFWHLKEEIPMELNKMFAKRKNDILAGSLQNGIIRLQLLVCERDMAAALIGVARAPVPNRAAGRLAKRFLRRMV